MITTMVWLWCDNNGGFRVFEVINVGVGFGEVIILLSIAIFIRRLLVVASGIRLVFVGRTAVGGVRLSR